MHFVNTTTISYQVAKTLAQLRTWLDSHSVDIAFEHVGATAVPNVWTKGDVDVAISVSQSEFGPLVAKLTHCLEKRQVENWTAEFASFGNDTRFELPVGVQLVVCGTENDVFCKIRDRLLSDDALRAKYSSLKESAKVGSVEYSELKHLFFQSLLSGK